MASEVHDLPEDVRNRMEQFDESLGEVEDVLKPFLKIPISDVREKLSDPLQNAKLDLMVAYTANSLFWTYLVTQGVDAKEHPVKDELIRIKNYMARIQSIQDKKKMARIDTHAAKRFLRNALWEAPASKDDSTDMQQSNSPQKLDSPQQRNSSKSHKKRKRNEDSQKKKKKKKKKQD